MTILKPQCFRKANIENCYKMLQIPAFVQSNGYVFEGTVTEIDKKKKKLKLT